MSSSLEGERRSLGFLKKEPAGSSETTACHYFCSSSESHVPAFDGGGQKMVSVPIIGIHPLISHHICCGIGKSLVLSAGPGQNPHPHGPYLVERYRGCQVCPSRIIINRDNPVIVGIQLAASCPFKRMVGMAAKPLKQATVNSRLVTSGPAISPATDGAVR